MRNSQIRYIGLRSHGSGNVVTFGNWSSPPTTDPYESDPAMQTSELMTWKRRDLVSAYTLATLVGLNFLKNYKYADADTVLQSTISPGHILRRNGPFRSTPAKWFLTIVFPVACQPLRAISCYMSTIVINAQLWEICCGR